MEERFRSKLGFSLFFFLIIFLLVGGFIYTKTTINKKNVPKKDEKEKIDYRIDKEKDYIYFDNESVISEEGKIYYKDVIINLNTQTVLTEGLKKENQINKESIKYIKDQELISDDIVKYNYDGIYSLTFRDYKTYKFDKYASLVILDYNYSCFDNVTFNKSKAYTFDIENGTLLSGDDLLNKYSMNMDIVKEKIREYLNTKQSVENGEEIIKIDDTINELNENSLFINEYNKLTISYLVKTSQTDYNYNEITEVS